MICVVFGSSEKWIRVFIEFFEKLDFTFNLLSRNLIHQSINNLIGVVVAGFNDLLLDLGANGVEFLWHLQLSYLVLILWYELLRRWRVIFTILYQRHQSLIKN
jgi:hypothetical protein